MPIPSPELASPSYSVTTPAIIAIIGCCGIGKSLFINTICKSRMVRAGPCTEKIQGVRMEWGEGEAKKPVVLVDTPCFGSDMSVVGFFESIDDYLVKSHGPGTKLTGLIYMHCILDRAEAPDLSMFQGLFHSKSQVVVLTTCWDVVNRTKAVEREQQLKSGDTPSTAVLELGYCMMRHDNTHSSAKAVLDHLLRPKTILVMGPSGTGKTTFIRRLAEGSEMAVNEMAVNHTLDSGEFAVRESGEISFGSDSIVLVDTPGFDHSEADDARVLRLIANFITSRSVRFNGVIYMFADPDPAFRSRDRLERYFEAFCELCGRDALNRVMIIVTRLRGNPDQLEKLKGDIFQRVVEAGGHVVDGDCKQGSASVETSLGGLLQEHWKHTVDLKMQQEMWDKANIYNTSAYRVLYKNKVSAGFWRDTLRGELFGKKS